MILGSDYFGACWENLIKKDEVDIIFVEHGSVAACRVSHPKLLSSSRVSLSPRFV